MLLTIIFLKEEAATAGRVNQKWSFCFCSSCRSPLSSFSSAPFCSCCTCCWSAASAEPSRRGLSSSRSTWAAATRWCRLSHTTKPCTTTRKLPVRNSNLWYPEGCTETTTARVRKCEALQLILLQWNETCGILRKYNLITELIAQLRLQGFLGSDRCHQKES